MSLLTAAAVRAARFGRPSWGRRGYDPEQVEALRVRVADALDTLAAGRAPAVTADDVHSVVFAKPRLGRGRGYDEDEVDVFLDQVETVLRAGAGGLGVPELNGRPLTR
jgi:DivIVA domain-containing protein